MKILSFHIHFNMFLFHYLDIIIKWTINYLIFYNMTQIILILIKMEKYQQHFQFHITIQVYGQ